MRSIIEGKHFSECVERLGGARIIDEAMEPIIETLQRNPYGYELIENDWTSVRFVRTAAIGGYVPSLVIAFTINDDKNVVLEWVDEIDDAEDAD